MQIGIDITVLHAHHKSGIHYYCQNLVESLIALVKDERDIQLVLFDTYYASGRSAPIAINGTSNVQYCDALPLRWIPYFPISRALVCHTWNRGVRRLRSECDRWLQLRASLLSQIDILHIPVTTFKPIHKIPRSRKIITIADIIALIHPNMFPSHLIKAVQKCCHFARETAEQVIVHTECTQADLIRVAGIPKQKIAVIPHGVKHEQFHPLRKTPELRTVLSRYALEGRRYILSVATLEPRKNLDRLVEAFCAIGMHREYDDVLLALVGGKGWLIDDFFKKLAVLEPKLQERIRILGYVPDADLPYLYSGATAFAYISLYEGFGLPVVEAMACGTPVVISDVAALSEVAGDAACRVDPYDTRAIGRAIRRLLDNPTLREDMSGRAVERAQTFSWARSAEEHLRVYRQCGFS